MVMEQSCPVRRHCAAVQLMVMEQSCPVKGQLRSCPVNGNGAELSGEGTLRSCPVNGNVASCCSGREKSAKADQPSCRVAVADSATVRCPVNEDSCLQRSLSVVPP